jgi:hypothetical protein
MVTGSAKCGGRARQGAAGKRCGTTASACAYLSDYFDMALLVGLLSPDKSTVRLLRVDSQGNRRFIQAQPPADLLIYDHQERRPASLDHSCL